jgi:hypothetical protein
MDPVEHKLIVTYATPYEAQCACGATFIPQTVFSLLAVQWLAHIEQGLLRAVIPKQE